MSTALKYLLIILIAAIVLTIVYATYTVVSHEEVEPLYTYNEIRPQLQTGDLILFSKNKHSDLATKLAYIARTQLLSTKYGHIGIVYKTDSGHLYLIECVSPNQTAADKATYFGPKQDGGLRIIDLDTLIYAYAEQNDGDFALVPITTPIDNTLFLSALASIGKPVFQDNSTLIALAFVDTVISHRLALWLSSKIHGPGMMCSEFIYELLMKCGIVPYYEAKIFWPHFFTNGFFTKLANGAYGEPVSFKL